MNIAPEKIDRAPKGKGSSSNHPFSGCYVKLRGGVPGFLGCLYVDWPQRVPLKAADIPIGGCTSWFRVKNFPPFKIHRFFCRFQPNQNPHIMMIMTNPQTSYALSWETKNSPNKNDLPQDFVRHPTFYGSFGSGFLFPLPHRVFASVSRGVLPPQVSASVDSKYIASTEEVDWVRWNFRPVLGGKFGWWSDQWLISPINGAYKLWYIGVLKTHGS